MDVVGRKLLLVLLSLASTFSPSSSHFVMDFIYELGHARAGVYYGNDTLVPISSLNLVLVFARMATVFIALCNSQSHNYPTSTHPKLEIQSSPRATSLISDGATNQKHKDADDRLSQGPQPAWSPTSNTCRSPAERKQPRPIAQPQGRKRAGLGHVQAASMGAAIV